MSRRRMAELVVTARDLDAKAAGHVEKALAAG